MVAFAAAHFGTSRQAVHRHLHKLVDAGLISASGERRGRRYELATLESDLKGYAVGPELEEDVVWRRDFAPRVRGLDPNVVEICQYGFSEMVNNVRDHSESDRLSISFERNAVEVSFLISDRGVGIFEKIQRACRLEDARQAVLELTKGKLTTDPTHHSGEGIFFTSRMFDRFSILSDRLYLSTDQGDDWLLESRDRVDGTTVSLRIKIGSQRTTREVFDRYSREQDDFGFVRTHVPVGLARYEGESLLSRSQAKRLLARVDRFREVVLDFKGVESIGQPFADETFRVYPAAHPNVHLLPVNMTEAVKRMVAHVLAEQPAEIRARILGSS